MEFVLQDVTAKDGNGCCRVGFAVICIFTRAGGWSSPHSNPGIFPWGLFIIIVACGRMDGLAGCWFLVHGVHERLST